MRFFQSSDSKLGVTFPPKNTWHLVGKGQHKGQSQTNNYSPKVAVLLLRHLSLEFGRRTHENLTASYIVLC